MAARFRPGQRVAILAGAYAGRTGRVRRAWRGRVGNAAAHGAYVAVDGSAEGEGWAVPFVGRYWADDLRPLAAE